MIAAAPRLKRQSTMMHTVDTTAYAYTNTMNIEQSVAIRKGPAGNGRKLGSSARLVRDATQEDASQDTGVPEQLIALLAKSWTRVRDVFSEWDRDQSGSIDIGEFMKAMRVLGLSCTPDEARALFRMWDSDASGEIDFREMNGLLKRHVGYKTAKEKKAEARLEVGGAAGGKGDFQADMERWRSREIKGATEQLRNLLADVLGDESLAAIEGALGGVQEHVFAGRTARALELSSRTIASPAALERVVLDKAVGRLQLPLNRFTPEAIGQLFARLDNGHGEVDLKDLNRWLVATPKPSHQPHRNRAKGAGGAEDVNGDSGSGSGSGSGDGAIEEREGVWTERRLGAAVARLLGREQVTPFQLFKLWDVDDEGGPHAWLERPALMEGMRTMLNDDDLWMAKVRMITGTLFERLGVLRGKGYMSRRVMTHADFGGWLERCSAPLEVGADGKIRPSSATPSPVKRRLAQAPRMISPSAKVGAVTTAAAVAPPTSPASQMSRRPHSARARLVRSSKKEEEERKGSGGGSGGGSGDVATEFAWYSPHHKGLMLASCGEGTTTSTPTPSPPPSHREPGCPPGWLQAEIKAKLAKNLTRVMDLFREADVDEDGAITMDEFRSAIAKDKALNASEEDLRELYALIDADGSDSISFKELNRVLAKARGAAASSAVAPSRAAALLKSRPQSARSWTSVRSIDGAAEHIGVAADTHRWPRSPLSRRVRGQVIFSRPSSAPAKHMEQRKQAVLGAEEQPASTSQHVPTAKLAKDPSVNSKHTFVSRGGLYHVPFRRWLDLSSAVPPKLLTAQNAQVFSRPSGSHALLTSGFSYARSLTK